MNSKTTHFKIHEPQCSFSVQMNMGKTSFIYFFLFDCFFSRGLVLSNSFNSHAYNITSSTSGFISMLSTPTTRVPDLLFFTIIGFSCSAHQLSQPPAHAAAPCSQSPSSHIEDRSSMLPQCSCLFFHLLYTSLDMFTLSDCLLTNYKLFYSHLLCLPRLLLRVIAFLFL